MASLGNEGAIMTQVARRVETLHETAFCPPVFNRAAGAAVHRRVTPAAGEATMLATCAANNRFPGTVSALLAGAEGDTDRLAESVTSFCAEAPGLLRSLARAVEAGNAQAVSRAASSLYGRLATFGVPHLRTVAATLEDYAQARDLGPAAPLVDELAAAVAGFCAYLATKPWLR
jgi:HPt (histidine-containing phosphotransfer) domain-containing protein